MALFNKPDPKAAKSEAVAPVAPQVESPASTPVAAPESRVEDKPVVIISEHDSYIRELIRSQDNNPETATAHVDDLERFGWTRLSLPDFFEELSADCTRGDACVIHRKRTIDVGVGLRRVELLNPGKYVFRWVNKRKPALDYAKNVKKWQIVNSIMFRESPRELFRASGAVEEGDAVLMFTSVARAKRIREIPGERSNELLRGRMTRTRRGMVMTGNMEDDRVYEPELGPTREERVEEQAAEQNV